MVFVGPSWSWVSMTGCHTTYDLMWRETRSPGAVLDDGLSVVAVNSELRNPNPFGEVLASAITLTGRLVPVNVLKQGRAHILLEEGNNVGELDLDDNEALSGSIWALVIIHNKDEHYTISIALVESKTAPREAREYRRVGVAYIKADNFRQRELETIRIV